MASSWRCAGQSPSKRTDCLKHPGDALQLSVTAFDDVYDQDGERGDSFGAAVSSRSAAAHAFAAAARHLSSARICLARTSDLQRCRTLALRSTPWFAAPNVRSWFRHRGHDQIIRLSRPNVSEQIDQLWSE